MTCFKQKTKLFFVTRNIFRYQTTKLLKIWFLFLVSVKGQKKDKIEFVTKFVRIIVTIVFLKKVSQIACKIFAEFFTDHLKYKIANKRTCRAPSPNPGQIFAHELKRFPSVIIIF